MKKNLLALVLFLSCAPAPLPAQWRYDRDAVLISTEGAVTLRDAQGISQAGKTGLEVSPGGVVSAGGDSKAVLRFFDGSVLVVESNTQLRVRSLDHPAGQQKMIRFDLLAGLVEATVHKLMTASSLFEIEAGGVVCGVRGTRFSVAYDPAGELVHVKVAEGTVYAKAKGDTFLITAGGEIEFIHDHPIAGPHGKQNFAAPRPGEGTGESAVHPVLGAATALKEGEGFSSSLRDLDAQFMAGLSVNGGSLGSSPVLGGTVLPNTSLALTSPLSSVGLRGSLPVGLPVKLPGLP